MKVAITLAALAASAAAAPAAGTRLTLSLVDNTTCIDGSPAGYYYAPPASRDGVWVVYLQGGGACKSLADCKQRAKGSLGSSRFWARTKTTSWPLLLDDPARNPDFADAHHVFVPYGSGDTYKGTRKASVATDGLAFTGHIDLITIFNDLEAKYGFLSRSTHVLLSGDSAGGIGTFVNADVLAGMFTSKPVYKIAPSAGLFYPLSLPELAKDVKDPPSNYSCYAAGEICGTADDAPALAKLWGNYRDPRCLADNTGDKSYHCDSMGVYMHYISTPMYVLEHQYDTNQLFAQQACPFKTSDPTVLKYIKDYGRAIRATTALVTRDVDGLFSPSCLDHDVDGTIEVDGLNWPTLVSDWFWGHGRYAGKYKMSEGCEAEDGLPCNARGACRL